MGHHLTVFHMSKNIKVIFGIEPFLHARRMGCVAPVEGRVPYFTKGTIEVSADKEQDVKTDSRSWATRWDKPWISNSSAMKGGVPL